MNRVLLLTAAAAAPALWAEVDGRYRYAELTVNPGAALQAAVRSGEVTIGKRPGGARFSIGHPAAPGQTLALAAPAEGGVLAGSAVSGPTSIFIALRAAEPGQAVALGAGEWSAVMISLEAGKARGLRTAFLDFTVGAGGAISNGAMISHEASVDDVSRAEPVGLKSSEPGSLELLGLKHAVAVAAAGDMFLATAPAPAHPSLIIAARRDRDATTMAIRGTYALAEIGARNTFPFAPDLARFYATAGTLQADGGQARISQRVKFAESAAEFRGLAAYMLNGGGAGTFSPRLEQRRRNLAVSGDGTVFLTAQVSEAGRLSLLHGVGIGIRVNEPVPPAIAARATAHDDVVSLYGRNLEGVQARIGGQPAAVVKAWPNQIDIKPATAPTGSPLNVELDWQGGRTAPVSVAIAPMPPDFASAPAAPGGFIAPTQAAPPGDTIEFGLSGAVPPAGFVVLFDGIAGQVHSCVYSGGLNRVKATLPANLGPGPAVNVAIAAPGYYIDLGDMPVSRPRAVAQAAPASAH